MEEQIERLARKAWNKYMDLPPAQRLLFVISGMPGSGKSTLAAVITERLNTLARDEHISSQPDTNVAALVPMDGFHFTRAQLDAMPDPVHAHVRRGAAFTFDAARYLNLIERLREPLSSGSSIFAPSFDHGEGDPVENGIEIRPSARIIICEGNYLSLGTGAQEWRRAAELMNELWFVEVHEDIARQRLVVRHMISGRTEEEARKRADDNDLPNGRDIVAGRLPVQEIVRSVEDAALQPICPYMASA